MELQEISTFYYNKTGNFCLRVSSEAPFYWKMLKIGILQVYKFCSNSIHRQVVKEVLETMYILENHCFRSIIDGCLAYISVDVTLTNTELYKVELNALL